MLDKGKIKELKELSEGLTLLYVEDNDRLREKASALLQKLFDNVISAADGEEGYILFKENRPEIVISDIKMPKLNGLDMIKKIKKIQPSTKFIVTTAFDEKELLHQAIELGVFYYMQKPMKIEELATTLRRCIQSINMEDSSSLFNSYMADMLNYQSDMLALMSKTRPLFVNQMFLNFFDLENIDEFEDKYGDFGSLLLEHNGFLYNHDNIDWFREASQGADKLFHVKITDQQNNYRHFILKMHPLPKKANMYIMSLNDITDLNLLSLFDSKAVENDEKIKSRVTIMKLMEVVHKNNAEIKIHNFYKGLTITNLGLIAKMKGEYLTVKTSYMQQKASQYQKSILISSEIFPAAVLCEPIEKIDFERQSIIVKEMKFLQRNPTQRKSVRVQPEDHHTVSLFFENRKFYGEVMIHDLSVEAVKLEVNALPAGLKEATEVSVDMVLEHDRKPIIINTPAQVLRINEMPRSFYIILTLKHTDQQKKVLIDYVAKRQMSLIREFKGMQFG